MFLWHWKETKSLRFHQTPGDSGPRQKIWKKPQYKASNKPIEALHRQLEITYSACKLVIAQDVFVGSASPFKTRQFNLLTRSVCSKNPRTSWKQNASDLSQQDRSTCPTVLDESFNLLPKQIYHVRLLRNHQIDMNYEAQRSEHVPCSHLMTPTSVAEKNCKVNQRGRGWIMNDVIV